ncbi:4-hydroxy-2-oxoglutarate aldolase, mitochondrial [Aspergillus alliaceus]|uniref:4-hydroxy-2-oxoglutarate aldolase, mitochondrial n=1 Tax=Petromyces alliaceus TaxID=209559 RepID=A0A8H6A7J5_PETAA|nr:4-hydroxy-2-oxoglutarate aldolase, mitochondrial [Aspergillus burnettii]
MSSAQPPRYGVYSPMVTFFNEDESIEYKSITQHVERLLSSGVAGVVMHGSNGEAIHLLREELAQIIYHVRRVPGKDYPSAVLLQDAAPAAPGLRPHHIDLAKTYPQIVGAKLTCGDLGKLQRLSASLPTTKFGPFARKADFLLPGLIVGSNGIVSALANLVPKLHIEAARLYKAGKLQGAQEIQWKLSVAD